MAETVAAPASAFAGLFLPAVVGVTQVNEAPATARFSLRAREEARATLEAALGVALPERINRAAERGATAALRLGPDEWLVLAEPTAADGLIATAAARGATVPHALVEISDRTAGVLVTGPAVEAVLAAGCPLPLDSDAFPVGRATRTLFGKAEIVLWRQAADRFRIEAGRSFVPYLVGLLAETIRQEAAIRRLPAPAI